jgi:hypothetical protein
MEALKPNSQQKKLGIFARIKYKSIIKEINSPATDEYLVYKKTKGWFAKKYPEKAAEIAGRLVEKGEKNSLGIIKAAELAEYLANKGKTEQAGRIAALIESSAVMGMYVPKEAKETLGRVRDRLHKPGQEPQRL